MIFHHFQYASLVFVYLMFMPSSKTNYIALTKYGDAIYIRHKVHKSLIDLYLGNLLGLECCI